MMSSNRFMGCIWIIFVIAAGLSWAQDLIISGDDDKVSEDSAKVLEKLLIQMKDVKDIDDFIARFIDQESLVYDYDADFQPLTVDEEYQQPVMRSHPKAKSGVGKSDNGSGIAASSGKISLHAACQPESQVVQLEKDDEMSIQFPTCVRMRRCGGCCSSHLTECLPVATSLLNVTVLKLKFIPQISTDKFQSGGQQIHTLEQHDRCACQCTIQPKNCAPSQIYKPDECRCACQNHKESDSCTNPKRTWDSIECACRCKEVKECSTGRFFNSSTCRCEAMKRFLGVRKLNRNSSTASL